MSKLIITNGCFDILHPGHLYLINEAKKLGTLLILINCDLSVRELKGPTRPVNPIHVRVHNLQVHHPHVIPFHHEEYLAYLQLLRPHIIVKGGDYTYQQIIHDTGGLAEVVIVPYLPGYSTTQILANGRLN